MGRIGAGYNSSSKQPHKARFHGRKLANRVVKLVDRVNQRRSQFRRCLRAKLGLNQEEPAASVFPCLFDSTPFNGIPQDVAQACGSAAVHRIGDMGAAIESDVLDAHALVIIKETGSIFFKGTMEYRTILGRTSCFGFEEQARHTVTHSRWTLAFSANTGPLLQLRNTTFLHVQRRSMNATVVRLKNRLSPYFSSKLISNQILPFFVNYGPFSSVVLLRRTQQYSLPGLWLLTSTQPGLFARTPGEDGLQVVSLFTPRVQAASPELLLLPHTHATSSANTTVRWLQSKNLHTAAMDVSQWLGGALAAESTLPTIACVGHKNAGKSTLCRYLLNHLRSHCIQDLPSLRYIFYLDIDVGQTEFFLPGCITVTCFDQSSPETARLGSAVAAHRLEPDFSVFYGDIKTNDAPARYLKAVERAISYVRSRTQSLVDSACVIVNTNGFTVGIGLEMLGKCIDMLDIDLVIEAVRPSSPAVASRVLHNCDRQVSILRVPSYRRDHDRTLPPYKPRNMRDMAFINYFAHIPALSREHCLASVTPYRLSFDDVWLQILSSDVTQKCRFHYTWVEIRCVLSVSLVALCSYNPKNAARTSGNLAHPRIVPQVRILECHGFGLVRNISLEDRVFYVLTPLPLKDLHAKVNTLGYSGGITLPWDLFQLQKQKNLRKNCSLPHTCNFASAEAMQTAIGPVAYRLTTDERRSAAVSRPRVYRVHQ